MATFNEALDHLKRGGAVRYIKAKTGTNAKGVDKILYLKGSRMYYRRLDGRPSASGNHQVCLTVSSILSNDWILIPLEDFKV